MKVPIYQIKLSNIIKLFFIILILLLLLLLVTAKRRQFDKYVFEFKVLTPEGTFLQDVEMNVQCEVQDEAAQQYFVRSPGPKYLVKTHGPKYLVEYLFFLKDIPSLSHFNKRIEPASFSFDVEKQGFVTNSFRFSMDELKRGYHTNTYENNASGFTTFVFHIPDVVLERKKGSDVESSSTGKTP